MRVIRNLTVHDAIAGIGKEYLFKFSQMYIPYWWSPS